MKKVNPDGSKTIYVGGVYEVDKTSGGCVTRILTYYPAAGAMRINSTLYYVLKDHLGSASVVTDSTGATVGEQRYYPFGETRLMSGSMFTDKLFTGQREMAGLGIYHYNARFYSATLGRFLSADTIVPGAADPQAFNRYSYVLNSPMNYVDPTGHNLSCAGGLICHGPTIPRCTTPACAPAPSRGDGGEGGEEGGGGGGSSLIGCQTQCTLEDIQNAPLHERLDWFQGLRRNMTDTLGYSAGGWFRNIATVVAGFEITGQGANSSWTLNVDATILFELQEGYSAHLDDRSSGLSNGGGEWLTFFNMLVAGTSERDLISQWGIAEKTATGDGIAQWGPPTQVDDNLFVMIGYAYRETQAIYCNG